MGDFIIQDCSLLAKTSGLPAAINLRELRDRIAVCSQDVLYHHFCETPLVPSFDNPDYRNDLALWALLQLGDRVLAEQLGIINPYIFPDLEELREQVLEILDERLSEGYFVPSCQPGGEFLFTEAVTVVFDTGKQIESPKVLPEAIGTMTNGSIYYHFFEARRCEPVGVDNFSAWLGQVFLARSLGVEPCRRWILFFLPFLNSGESWCGFSEKEVWHDSISLVV